MVTQRSAPDAALIDGLKMMWRIRLFEDRVRREFAKGDIPGFVHTSHGVEAVAAGVCAHLSTRDLITSTHRGHGHCIAKGCEFKPMVAELFGRETGLCKGRGGSMHIADFSRGMLGANAIVGAGIALATGGALAAQTLRDGRVSVTFFGDGASNQGIFHESLNLAAIWKLPVVYVCENNAWAESTPVSYSTSVTNIADRAAAYGIPGVIVEGWDFQKVRHVAGEAVQRARAGDGPTLIEAKVRRLSGHFIGDPEQYRSKDDQREAWAYDPVAWLERALLEKHPELEAEVARFRESVEQELDEAYEYARASAWPDPSEVERYVLGD